MPVDVCLSPGFEIHRNETVNYFSSKVSKLSLLTFQGSLLCQQGSLQIWRKIVHDGRGLIFAVSKIPSRTNRGTFSHVIWKSRANETYPFVPYIILFMRLLCKMRNTLAFSELNSLEKWLMILFLLNDDWLWGEETHLSCIIYIEDLYCWSTTQVLLH